MKRARLGTWTTPSGNSVDVFLAPGTDVRDLQFAWDDFPLTPDDELHYLVVILPAVMARVREYLELVRRPLVVIA